MQTAITSWANVGVSAEIYKKSTNFKVFCEALKVGVGERWDWPELS